MRQVALLISTLVAAPFAFADDAAVTRVGERLAVILAPYVEPLDRSLVTFRYEANANFKPRTLADVIKHISGRPEQFGDTAVTKYYHMGPGVYAAVDPASTREAYGLATPNLFILTLKKHAIVYDAARPLDKRAFDQSSALIAEMGCEATGFKTGQFVGALRESSNVDCRAIATYAMRRLGVQAILYEYGASSTIDDCRSHRPFAFNVIQSSALDFSRLAWVSDHHALGDGALIALTRRLFLEAARDRYQMEDEPILPAHLVHHHENLPQYERWKSQKIYSCGGRRHGEHQRPPSASTEAALSQAFRDQDLRTLDRKVSKAYARIQNETDQAYYDVWQLRWVQQLTYEASGARAAQVSPEAWRRAMHLVNSIDGDEVFKDERFSQALHLLRETIPNAPHLDRTAIEEDLARDAAHAKGPYDPRVSLAQRDFPPLIRHLLFLQLVRNANGLPLLVASAAGTDMTSSIVRSRTLLRTILETCLAEYQDTSRSFAAINEGRCAIVPAP